MEKYLLKHFSKIITKHKNSYGISPQLLRVDEFGAKLPSLLRGHIILYDSPFSITFAGCDYDNYPINERMIEVCNNKLHGCKCLDFSVDKELKSLQLNHIEELFCCGFKANKELFFSILEFADYMGKSENEMTCIIYNSIQQINGYYNICQEIFNPDDHNPKRVQYEKYARLVQVMNDYLNSLFVMLQKFRGIKIVCYTESFLSVTDDLKFLDNFVLDSRIKLMKRITPNVKDLTMKDIKQNQFSINITLFTTKYYIKMLQFYRHCCGIEIESFVYYLNPKNIKKYHRFVNDIHKSLYITIFELIYNKFF